MLSFLEPLSGYGGPILRTIIAIVFLVHGVPKLKMAAAMAPMMGMPARMIRIQGVIEISAAIGLALGIFMNLSALVLAIIIAGAILVKNFRWKLSFAAPANRTGWEFDLVILGGLLMLLLG